MKFNLNMLYKAHIVTAFMLLLLTIVSCVQTTIMFGLDMSMNYAWSPSTPFMLSSLIVVILAIYKRHIAFIIGLIQVVLTLQTFETFLQIPTWEISFNIYLFTTFRFVAELIAIFNLMFLITSLFGTYLFVKKVFSQKRSG